MTTHCVLCGSIPAADVSLYQHRGVLIFPRWGRDKGPFCRSCGLSLFRDRTATTLIWTCWSLVAVVLAPLAVFLNLRARHRLLALAPPAERADVVTENRAPLPPSKPVLAHPLAWLSPLLLVAVLSVISLTTWPTTAREDIVGNCVRLTSSWWRDEATFVTCDRPHDARITKITIDWGDCPGQPPYYVEFDYRYYCLTKDPT